MDSGADFSIFHRSVLDLLGIDRKQGKLRRVDNADGTTFEVQELLLSVELAGVRFPARICFAENPALTEFPLLGRLDIFDKFRITFCEQEQYVELQPYAR